MNYLFSGFKLNTEKRELYYQSEIVGLTKQNFQLLLYFVQKPNAVIDKDELIKHVWNGRVVADNTIDQSIYKLKKILISINPQTYFETVYGLGIKFLPEVIESNSVIKSSVKQSNSFHQLNLKILMPLSLLVFVLFTLWVNKDSVIPSPVNSVLVLPNEISASSDAWLNNSTNIYMEKLLKTSPKISLKNYQVKPTNLNQQQYIDTQWKLNPLLKVVNSNVSIQRDEFILLLTIKDNAGLINEKEFKNKHLSHAYVDALNWLKQEFKLNTDTLKSTWIIPKQPYALELYLRGLSAVAQNKPDQAINYFELSLEKNPEYHNASLELAKLFEDKGDINQALALLDTTLSINKIDEIKIDATNQKAGILLRKGQPKKALTLYKGLLDSYQAYQGLLDTRYKVALVYRSLLQNDKALSEFNALESEIRETDNFDLLANVYQAQASILLQQGKKEKALLKVQKAMDMFMQLANLMGQAKTHSIIARIAKTSSDYPAAITHLKQALNITKGLKHSFGIGATLNELIDTLIEQGKLNEAWKLNQELEKIAIKIDFTAMLLASKRFTFIIADIKGHAVKASIYLNEHREIAQATENKIAMMQNRFMSMSLQLSQGNLDTVNNDLIDLEDFIYQSKESSLKLNYNLVKAQYLFQSKRDEKAQALLVSSKDLAQSSGDFQSIIEINNLLAEVYLKQDKADKALGVLQQSLKYNPPVHPFLLLQSKANNKLNNITKALNLANQCKRGSFDLWTSKNEQYLSALLTKIKDNK